MPARPTLVSVGVEQSTGGPLAIDGFDVLTVTSRAGVEAQVDGVLESLCTDRPSRWLLLEQGYGGAVAARVVEEVLGGRVPVFGLAGVVLVGDTSVAVDGGVPLLGLDPGRLCTAAPVIAEFWADRAGRGPVTPDDVVELLASGRVSARTRGAHARRVLADDPAYSPAALDSDQLEVLRAIADRVVPQEGSPDRWLDLAARVDAQLAAGRGDGWRHADLPPDLKAYRAAMDELCDLPGVSADEQDAVLADVAGGRRTTRGSLSSEQLSLWFEDARVDLVRHWLAHPATMSRIGYDGFAGGGDETFPGFARLELGVREDWEPAMPPAGSSNKTQEEAR